MDQKIALLNMAITSQRDTDKAIINGLKSEIHVNDTGIGHGLKDWAINGDLPVNGNQIKVANGSQTQRESVAGGSSSG